MHVNQEKESPAKSDLPTGGNSGEKNPSVSKHWLQTDTQVHVHIAKRRQTPSVLTVHPAAKQWGIMEALEKLWLCPLKEWHHLDFSS